MIDRARPVRSGLPAGSVSSTRTDLFDGGWTVCSTDPGTIEHPDALGEGRDWLPATVPGTVASAVGPEELDAHVDYDQRDWWYRRTVEAAHHDDAARTVLRFDGLATLAEVWFNGEMVLRSTNMFLAHEVDVSDLVRDQNELVLAFRSLTSALSEKRPRPRWKTNLVDHQQLRWFRTTLLGRIPGWTPAIGPVGPWREVSMETVRSLDVDALRIDARLDEGRGVVHVSASGDAVLPDLVLTGATLHVGGEQGALSASMESGRWSVAGSLEILDPDLWWPHTHGQPALYPVRLVLESSAGQVTIDGGEVGFRRVEAFDDDGSIRFTVNGTPVFCRGACWTTNDVRTLVGDPEAMRSKLRLAAQANANMIRVGGTMVYESDAFYTECDRLGIMVWQDFMFANMDYPADDDDFVLTVDAEVRQQATRLGRHASVVAWCGGSEVEQQAAMFGAPRDAWSNELFSTRIPQILAELHPGTLYWPSTPTGGVMPFHVGTGLAHYYGVGAYKRPLDDVRLAGVQLTPECLGFSNLPEPENLRLLGTHASTVPHHPAWKTGVPRDSAAGWDFEDIRDHYMELLYGVDPVTLRSEDPQGYLRVARVVTGRVMSHVYQEWRAPDNPCTGGLVWFFNDLRPGAGWGILDSDGAPKPVYYFLQRAWAPRAIFILDRGLDGVRIDVHNEGSTPLEGELRVRLYGDESRVLAEASRPLDVPGRGHASASAEALLDRFSDPTYSYRFGPRAHVAIEARHTATDGSEVSTIYWPSLANAPGTSVRGTLAEDGSGRIESDGLGMDVRIELKSRVPSKNYFDLAPGETRSFTSEARGGAPARARGAVEATNDPVGSRLQAEG